MAVEGLWKNTAQDYWPCVQEKLAIFCCLQEPGAALQIPLALLP